MKVKELMNQLNNFDPNSEITILLITDNNDVRKLYDKEYILGAVSKTENNAQITIYDSQVNFQN